ncbi:MAG TPA: hypothetical protein DD808_07465 [Halieaceae bacterium]|jgi:LPS O-antigen subunit length determinant protein (WzzB/FepE family)|uniref:Wzz/FepE/Etk N-terminal domain-containing protein n=1 Tax=Haliea sp. TaxID=1932666 RepID=UPI000C358827|nr:Wzz/FepE/Etk N-terminal domain-containing protein [Haliea sp.]HAN67957.1 hypothetical protein [Halieaceae bacterium]MAD63930.1 hypothetical protein [Haliea sp.]MAY92291.1 hypothetical protein [Haliea sp.]MBK42215.1 hypothetical protein [Haliea sp.]MBP68330.1 hypothetical protein [Haliea sp.]|tara:strand:+ start:1352 stop:2689 length:1338 start_codon:yes stop_codon:yes gene_type:complete
MTQLTSPPPPPQSPPLDWADDEIDLFELAASLWQRRWVVLGGTAIFLAFAAAYLLLTRPVYESTARLRPPLASQLVAINETGHMELPPGDAFSRVVFEARSLDTQREVFLAFSQRLLEEPSVSRERLVQHFLREFSPALTIEIGGLSKNDVLAETTMSIRFQHTDSQLAADVANAVATAAKTRALASVTDELHTVLEARARTLESRIVQSADILERRDKDTIVRLQEDDELKRWQLQDRIAALTIKARQLRADKIAELEEALAVARSLDITEPATLQMLSRSANGRESVSVSADLSTGQGDPLYLRGSRMLEAELAVLEKRTADAHMVPELRDLQEQLDLLGQNRQIEILQARENYEALVEDKDVLRAEISQLRELLAADYSDTLLARVDQPAIARSQPIKPKKGLTLAVATVAGTMLGILIALVMAAVENRRRSAPPPVPDTAQ